MVARRIRIGTPAVAGWTLLQNGIKGATGADTGATTDAVDTSGANLIVLVTTAGAGATLTVSDSKSNTWQHLTNTNDGGFSTKCQIHYCVSPTVGSGHTFSVAGTGSYANIVFQAWSGSHASPFDLEAGGATNGATASAGSGITPSQDNELVIFGCSGASTSTFDSINGGFTITNSHPLAGSQHYGAAMAYLVQSTAALADPDLTLSGAQDCASRIAGFKRA